MSPARFLFMRAVCSTDPLLPHALRLCINAKLFLRSAISCLRALKSPGGDSALARVRANKGL